MNRDEMVGQAKAFIDGTPEGTTHGALEWMADFALKQVAAERERARQAIETAENMICTGSYADYARQVQTRIIERIKAELESQRLGGKEW